MKTWINTIIKLWWIIQGIIMIWFGLLSWYQISFIGILMIGVGCLYDNRNYTVSVWSRLALILCTLVYAVIAGMMIAVGSPETEFAIGLIIVGIVSVLLSIKLAFNTLLQR